MAETQAEYNLPPMVEGTDWVGLPDGFNVTINGSPPIEELVNVRIQFRINPASRPASATLEPSEGNIAISDPSTWTVVIPPQKLALKAATYAYDIETTDAAGTVKKYIRGTLEVMPTITRNRGCLNGI